MSGHSKWATTKHKKAVIDAKRGKLFAKLIKNIEVAARQGGGDPSGNPTLYDAIQKAKKSSVPQDNIERAVKRGSGAESGGADWQTILYEGYGPSGVAVMVEALTDNRNRTGPEIKRIFEKHGGSLGASGCVNWMFSKKGLITVGSSAVDEDDLMELALGAGAEDMENTGEVFEITCEPSAYEELKKVLEAKEIPTEVAEISMMPQTMAEIGDEAVAKRVVSMMEAFDDHDDVQNAYANFDISDEVMAKLS